MLLFGDWIFFFAPPRTRQEQRSRDVVWAGRCGGILKHRPGPYGRRQRLHRRRSASITYGIAFCLRNVLRCHFKKGSTCSLCSRVRERTDALAEVPLTRNPRFERPGNSLPRAPGAPGSSAAGRKRNSSLRRPRRAAGSCVRRLVAALFAAAMLFAASAHAQTDVPSNWPLKPSRTKSWAASFVCCW